MALPIGIDETFSEGGFLVNLSGISTELRNTVLVEMYQIGWIRTISRQSPKICTHWKVVRFRQPIVVDADSVIIVEGAKTSPHVPAGLPAQTSA